MQLRELGLQNLWISLHIFSEKEGWNNSPPREHISIEAESNYEVFSVLDPTLLLKIRDFNISVIFQ